MTAKDTMGNGDYGWLSPANDAAAVSLSDSVDMAYVSRGIYVGTTGDVAAVMKGGEVVVFKTVPAGVILPIRATRINSTNTTASNLVAMW